MNILTNQVAGLPRRATRIAYLIRNYIFGKLTEQETTELHTWLTLTEENQKLFIEWTGMCKRRAVTRLSK